MHNPFGKPRTPGQWLLGSVCWTVCCISGWFLIVILSMSWRCPDTVIHVVNTTVFWFTHVLIWKRAVRSSSDILRTLETHTLIGFLSDAWFSLITLFQVVALVIGLIGTVLAILVPVTPGPFFNL